MHNYYDASHFCGETMMPLTNLAMLNRSYGPTLYQVSRLPVIMHFNRSSLEFFMGWEAALVV